MSPDPLPEGEREDESRPSSQGEREDESGEREDEWCLEDGLLGLGVEQVQPLGVDPQAHTVAHGDL